MGFTIFLFLVSFWESLRKHNLLNCTSLKDWMMKLPRKFFSLYQKFFYDPTYLIQYSYFLLFSLSIKSSLENLAYFHVHEYWKRIHITNHSQSYLLRKRYDYLISGNEAVVRSVLWFNLNYLLLILSC